MGVCHTKGIFVDGLDRTPDLSNLGLSILIPAKKGDSTYIDDLESLLQQLVGLIW
jgi:hypothetical protein